MPSVWVGLQNFNLSLPVIYYINLKVQTLRTNECGLKWVKWEIKQATEQKKLFEKDRSEKGLLFQIHRAHKPS